MKRQVKLVILLVIQLIGIVTYSGLEHPFEIHNSFNAQIELGTDESYALFHLGRMDTEVKNIELTVRVSGSNADGIAFIIGPSNFDGNDAVKVYNDQSDNGISGYLNEDITGGTTEEIEQSLNMIELFSIFVVGYYDDSWNTGDVNVQISGIIKMTMTYPVSYIFFICQIAAIGFALVLIILEGKSSKKEKDSPKEVTSTNIQTTKQPNSKFCESCGTQIKITATFCESCGSKIE